MTDLERNPRHLADFESEIGDMEKSFAGIGHRLAEVHSDRSLLGFQAEWHMRGIVYHLRRLYGSHAAFVHEVSSRASTGAAVLIMYAPSFQELLFEFYALVNLCRISLDNLRVYLAPVFVKNCDQLPKSVRDVLKGATDCPVYAALASANDLLTYLLDVRNCLVHYRSFATSDNAYVVEEGVDLPHIDESSDAFFTVMARADFRRIGEDAIAVNVLLPDRIFETDSRGNKRLAEFTYGERWSLLSTTRAFAQLAMVSLQHAVQLLIDTKTPVFEYRSKGTKA
jgi:hypothetical protein